MVEPCFRGKVEKGRVVLNEPERYAVYLAGLEGGDVDLVVRRHRAARTASQNRYLFGVVYAVIRDYSGYETTDEVHEAMKRMFLSIDRGDLPPTVQSTTELTTQEMTDYIESIRRWASSFLNVYIPDPWETWE
jgi:hypothetical protein